MSDEEQGVWLQVRMSHEDKAQLVQLAQDYGLTISALVRLMSTYFNEKRPTVTTSVQYAPKAGSLVGAGAEAR